MKRNESEKKNGNGGHPHSNKKARTTGGALVELLIAVREGKLERAKKIYFDEKEKEQLINTVFKPHGMTFLHIAADNNHPAIVSWLVPHSWTQQRLLESATILAKNSDGETALHLAAKRGLQVFRAIVDGCAQEIKRMLHTFDGEENSILHIAAANGQDAIIEWVLSNDGGRREGFNRVLARNTAGETALHVAARLGHVGSCQAIVNGARVDNGERAEFLNGLDDDRCTILHLAADGNHPAVVSWILSEEAGGGRALGFSKVFAIAGGHKTALHLAAKRGHVECGKALANGVRAAKRAQLLNAIHYQSSALHDAAENGHASFIEWLLSEAPGGGRALGFNLFNARTFSERTCLHLAARGGHLAACQAIVNGLRAGERAAMLNAVNSNSSTALNVAAKNGHLEVVHWFLSKEEGGAISLGFVPTFVLPDATKTALHSAAKSDNLDVFLAVLQGFAPDNKEEQAKLLNTTIRYARSHLDEAAEAGSISIIKWLLTEGRAMGFQCGEAGVQCALHNAAIGGRVNSIQILLNDPTLSKEQQTELLNAEVGGEALLEVAAEYGQSDVIDWLLSDEEGGGRSLGFTNVVNEGTTPMHDACSGGHLEACKALARGCKIENGELEKMLNSISRHGETILHCALSDQSIIQWILSDEEGGGRAFGFNKITMSDGMKSTALHDAARNRNLETVQLIVNLCKVENGERAQLLNDLNSDGRTVLFEAAARGNLDVIQWLLSNEEGGGRANGFIHRPMKDKKGETLLHHAANLQVFQVLLNSFDAEDRVMMLNSSSDDGVNLLHRTAYFNQIEIIEWLLSTDGGQAAGFNIENIFALTSKKETVLHLCIQRWRPEYFGLFLGQCKNAADRLRMLCTSNDQGQTIFHITALQNQVDFISRILREFPEESQLIINLRDNGGMTALHRAVFSSNMNARAGVVAALLGLQQQNEEEEEGQQQQHQQQIDEEESKKRVTADPNAGLKLP